MISYELGPQKALQNGAADTLLWEQGTIPSGSQVKAVSFVLTGANHDLDSISTIKFMMGGTEFVSFANDAQLMALVNSVGKRAYLAAASAAFTIPFRNIYGWPLNLPMCGAPPNSPLSIQIVTDGTGSAVGTITPVFHLGPEVPANSYPVWVSQQLAAGTPSNTSFAITQEGLLYGFVIDETNITALRFNYRGKDVFPFTSLAQINEVQDYWQGTTVTSPRTFYFPEPLPVVPGQTNLIVTASGAVGQIIPLILKPYA